MFIMGHTRWLVLSNSFGKGLFRDGIILSTKKSFNSYWDSHPGSSCRKSPSYSVFLLLQLFVPRLVLMDAVLTDDVSVMQVMREQPVIHVSNGQCQFDKEQSVAHASNRTNTHDLSTLLLSRVSDENPSKWYSFCINMTLLFVSSTVDNTH